MAFSTSKDANRDPVGDPANAVPRNFSAEHFHEVMKSHSASKTAADSTTTAKEPPRMTIVEKMALYNTCRQGNVEGLKLANPPDLREIRFARGETLLHCAVMFGQAEIAEILLTSFGMDVHDRDSQGNTPLHSAAWKGYDHLTRLLVKKYGADVDARDNDGLTPLHEAAWNGFENVAACLIEKCDANINARDKKGNTPLHIASHFKHGEMVQALLEYRADKHMKNEDGHTPDNMPDTSPSIAEIIRNFQAE